MLTQFQVCQIAYAVDDVRKFATRHSQIFGSGPFLMLEDAVITGDLRGETVTFTVDVAFGQWGDLQLELMRQKSGGRGLVSELYPDGRIGVHHVCSIVDDGPAVLAAFEAAGSPLVWTAEMAGGTRVYMVDTTDAVGHFTEFYENTEEIRGLYDGVMRASADFDGSIPVRPLAVSLATD